MPKHRPEPHPLKLFREAHDPPLSQQQLAQMLGVSRVSVTRYESRRRRPNSEVSYMIVQRTGIPLRDIRPDLAQLVDHAIAA